jgi:rare lipoprotein A
VLHKYCLIIVVWIICPIGGRAEDDALAPSKECGKASWYNHPKQGMTAAHKTIPKGTHLVVTTNHQKSVTVKVNDRGPFIKGRIIDLNKEAFKALAPLSTGVIHVCIEKRPPSKNTP